MITRESEEKKEPIVDHDYLQTNSILIKSRFMAISLNKEGVYSGPYWILLMFLLRSEYRHIKGILWVKETEGTFRYRR